MCVFNGIFSVLFSFKIKVEKTKLKFRLKLKLTPTTKIKNLISILICDKKKLS